MTEKINIKTLTQSELAAQLEAWNVETYRQDQIFKWIYQKDIAAFAEMTNLSKALRSQLEEKFFIGRMEPQSLQVSTDGTQKFLFALPDGETIESVLIPNEARQTLCISAQVGCAMACSFCLTGTLGLRRNLSHYEIVEQVMSAQRALGTQHRLSNIVYMGMGEPMHNLKNVLSSVEILLDQRGPNFSRNKVTVSTCGLVPQLLEFGEKCRAKLAISLTATTDAVRDKLIPINKKYPLEKLMQACRDYPLRKGERITFEYTLLKEINDSLADAKRLLALMRGIPAKINLIPYNVYPGSPYQRTSDEVVLSFQKYLLDRGLQANIRHSRGRDILGACGQLKAELEPRR